jgi:hypothetical protein
METGKKTGPYGPELLDCSPVRSEKKLDGTVRSSLRLDRSYENMHISNVSDCGKEPYNDSILYT